VDHPRCISSLIIARGGKCNLSNLPFAEISFGGSTSHPIGAPCTCNGYPSRPVAALKNPPVVCSACRTAVQKTGKKEGRPHRANEKEYKNQVVECALQLARLPDGFAPPSPSPFFLFLDPRLSGRSPPSPRTRRCGLRLRAIPS